MAHPSFSHSVVHSPSPLLSLSMSSLGFRSEVIILLQDEELGLEGGVGVGSREGNSKGWKGSYYCENLK